MKRTTINKRKVLDYWKKYYPSFGSILKEQTIFNIQDCTYDKCFCWGCGIERSKLNSLEACHIVPHSLGGSSEFENIVLMCSDCHFESPDHKNKNHFFKWLREKDSNFATVAKKVYSLLEDVDFIAAATSLNFEIQGIIEEEFNNIGTHAGRVKISTTLASVDEIRYRIIEEGSKTK